MNMILHGIEAPNIVHTNTLTENLANVQDEDRFDVIMANPPFGGKERPEVQQNFPIKTGETAFLFLQHFIKHLRAGGRAAIVIKNTFLSNSDGAARALRQELLESCNLHTVLSLFFQTDAYWQAIKDGSTGSAQGGFNATQVSRPRCAYSTSSRAEAYRCHSQ
jgi:type I restriction-modification system DNA methylase subunit